MEWAAEYESTTAASEAVEASFIKITGFSLPLDETSLARREDKIAGQIAGRPAFWGVDESDPDGGTFVVFALSSSLSVALEAFGVDVDDLRLYAESLQPVSAERWLQQHSQVRGVEGRIDS